MTVDLTINSDSPPSPEEAVQAREALTRLKDVLTSAGFDGSTHELLLQTRVGKGADRTVPLPARLLPMLVDLLRHVSAGDTVTLVPHHAELTTQEAASLLNVSRPFLIGLLDAGKIPHRMVGKHRRVAAADVFRYKRQEQEKREKALADLAADAQELGMGY